MTESSRELVKPADKKVTKFSLDQFTMQWQEFVLRRKRQREDKKWLDEFTPLLKKLSGNASKYLLQGREVAKLVPGQFNLAELETEQPDLVQEYTRFVTEQKFDEAAFKKDHPDLWEQYRVRRLTLVSGAPEIDGLS